MAIINGGAWGDISGKVGNLVASAGKNQSVLRSKPKPRRNKKFTAGQEAQQAKFSMASKLTDKLSNLIAVTYPKSATISRANQLYREILKEAITGVYPNLGIDYSKITVAKGKLTKAFNPAISSVTAGAVSFSWDDNSTMPNAAATDTAVLVVFCEEMQELMYTTNGATRSDATAEFNVSFFSGKQVHAWISFVSMATKECAASLYLGALNVL